MLEDCLCICLHSRLESGAYWIIDSIVLYMDVTFESVVMAMMILWSWLTANTVVNVLSSRCPLWLWKRSGPPAAQCAYHTAHRAVFSSCLSPAHSRLRCGWHPSPPRSSASAGTSPAARSCPRTLPSSARPSRAPFRNVRRSRRTVRWCSPQQEPLMVRSGSQAGGH